MDLHQQIARLEIRIGALVHDLRTSHPDSIERAEIRTALIPLFAMLVQLKMSRERMLVKPRRLEIVAQLMPQS